MQRNCLGGVDIEELFFAWRMFARGKLRRAQVQEFWLQLESNLFSLYREICEGRYRHGAYRHFVVQDTKRRDVFVASVRDRVVHQFVACYLERVCGPRMYKYSCAAQRKKGVSFTRAYVEDLLRRFEGRGVSVAHLDVARCYASIPHRELKIVLRRHVSDPMMIDLCERIIDSFGARDVGLPLGNITSQWFANIFLNELDVFVKHGLRVRYYMRYNDDIIIVAKNLIQLNEYVERICDFASQKLRLTIPPHKRKIIMLPRCVDVLGMRMNGHSHSLRFVTVARAVQRVRQGNIVWGEFVYDTLAAYQIMAPIGLDFLDVLML